jgi:hypothetical protein
MRRIFPLLITLFLLWSGCKNDLDVLADYKDIIVTYGLLNPADTAHYIRLSKVFGGEGNALTFAQQPDSIGFPVGTVDVKIQQWKNGQLIQTFQLYADTAIPRDPGVFQSPYQILYRGVFPVLTDGSIYKLSILDLRKGTTLTAQTQIVQHIAMVNPANSSVPLDLWDSTILDFKFKTGNYGLRYAFKIRFHYTEQFIYDTLQTSEHFVEWSLGEKDALNASGNMLLQYPVQRDNFLTFCGQQIPHNNYARRIAGKLDFIFVGASEDFATYLDVQTANSNTNAAVPPYSNTVGGYGLFASRTTTTLAGYWLDSDTREALRLSTSTQGLNFVR